MAKPIDKIKPKTKRKNIVLIVGYLIKRFHTKIKYLCVTVVMLERNKTRVKIIN